ncbi:hypothetical protein FRC16_001162 [Serendipita sp. 398]|nr:hypothetical protein FRC16_001162 [Serendipita sp. 398]
MSMSVPQRSENFWPIIISFEATRDKIRSVWYAEAELSTTGTVNRHAHNAITIVLMINCFRPHPFMDVRYHTVVKSAVRSDVDRRSE